MPEFNDALVSFKVGQLVRNERFLRWGLVVWDNKKYQFATGDYTQLLVFDTERRGTIAWPISDISVVVERGKIIHDDPLKVVKFQRMRSGDEDLGSLANVGFIGNAESEAAQHSPIVAKMCAILDRVNPDWFLTDNEPHSLEWHHQIDRRRAKRLVSGRTLDGVIHDGYPEPKGADHD